MAQLGVFPENIFKNLKIVNYLGTCHFDEDAIVGGTGGDQVNHTPETPSFVFKTPPVGLHPPAQPTCSERITASPAIIVDLQVQLEARDAKL